MSDDPERDEALAFVERQLAIDEAVEALGLATRWLNHYECDDCDVAWDDEWSCQVDDECPHCLRDISPYKSEEID